MATLQTLEWAGGHDHVAVEEKILAAANKLHAEGMLTELEFARIVTTRLRIRRRVEASGREWEGIDKYLDQKNRPTPGA